jgi:hypothetical protein
MSLTYQANGLAASGTQKDSVRCSLDLLQRSRLLQELAATVSAGQATKLSLPFDESAFCAWRDFESQRGTTPDALCCVLQVKHSEHVVLHVLCIRTLAGHR